MGKKTGWGVKWDVVKIGAGLFFPAGIPAAIMYYGYDRIYLALVVTTRGHQIARRRKPH